MTVTVGSKRAAGIVARINPEFDPEIKRKIINDYNYYISRSIEKSADEIRHELGVIKAKLADAIYNGDSTVELLINREVLYLLAEDMGLF